MKKEEIMKQFSNFLDDNLDAHEQSTPQTTESFDTGLKLLESIENILTREKTNDKLRAFVLPYKEALLDPNGPAQEMIYETFISGAADYTYINAVDTELSALKDRVQKNKQDIDIISILETMKDTISYYIVPLIESDVVGYLNNKTANGKIQLLDRLHNYSYDPFVKQIITAISMDKSVAAYLPNNDDISNSEKIYKEAVVSPVKYVNEKESIFAVKDRVYKLVNGDEVYLLPRDEFYKLDESFSTTVEILSLPEVEYNQYTKSLYYYHDANHRVSVNKEGITINGEHVDESLLTDPLYLYTNYGIDQPRFPNMVIKLNEAFNNLALLDFAYTYYPVNENDRSKSVTIFKFGNTLYTGTNNSLILESKFYGKTSAIQATRLVNSHLGTNFNYLYESSKGSVDKISKNIVNTKKQYESKINKLEDRKKKLKALIDEDSDDKSVKLALKSIDEDIEKTKGEFKKWQQKKSKLLNKEAESSKGVTDTLDDVKSEPGDGEVENNDIIDAYYDVPVSTDDVADPLTNDTESISVESDTSDADFDDPFGFDDTEFDEDYELDPTPYTGEDEFPDSNLGVPQTASGFDIVSVDFDKSISGSPLSSGKVRLSVPVVDRMDGIRVNEDYWTAHFTIGPDAPHESGIELELFIKSDSNSEMQIPLVLYNEIIESITNRNEYNDVRNITSGSPDFDVDDIEDFIGDFSSDSGQESFITPEIAGIAAEGLKEGQMYLFNRHGFLNESDLDLMLNSSEDEGVDNDSEFITDDTHREVTSNPFAGDAESIFNVISDMLSDEGDYDVVEVGEILYTPQDSESNRGVGVTSLDLTWLIEDPDGEDIDELEHIYVNPDGSNAVYIVDPSVLSDRDPDVVHGLITGYISEDDLIDVKNEATELYYGSFSLDDDLDTIIEAVEQSIISSLGSDYLINKEYEQVDPDEYSTLEESTKKKLFRSRRDDVITLSDDSILNDYAKSGDPLDNAIDREIKRAREEKVADSDSGDGTLITIPKFKISKANRITEGFSELYESGTPFYTGGNAASLKYKESKLTPQPLDKVIFKRSGVEGTITSVTQSGSLIVLSQGVTLEVDPSDVTVTTNRKDLWDVPYKVNESYIAALNEKHLLCAIFMNGAKLNTSPCYVKYSEYDKASLTDSVTILSEGESFMMQKGNIKLLENLDEVANINDYVEGLQLNTATGDVVRSLLLNAIQYTQSQDDNDLIDVIVDNEDVDTKSELIQLPKYMIKTLL